MNCSVYLNVVCHIENKLYVVVVVAMHAFDVFVAESLMTYSVFVPLFFLFFCQGLSCAYQGGAFP